MEVERREFETKALKLNRELSREIDRKKYWGTGVKIEEYSDAVTDNVDLTPLEETLEEFSEEKVTEKTSAENLFDDLASRIDFQELFQAGMVSRLQEIITETFKKGGSRVLTVDGDSLDMAFDVKPERIVDQLKSQEVYLKNLAEDAEDRVRESLIQGAEEGKSIGEMKDDILEDVEGMTEHRAETIARSEVTEASARGTEEAMEQAGVEEVTWAATTDRRICEPGTFSTRVEGSEYTSCEELHGESFDRRSAPRPVRDTHPNCRCAILANID